MVLNFKDKPPVLQEQTPNKGSLFTHILSTSNSGLSRPDVMVPQIINDEKKSKNSATHTTANASLIQSNINHVMLPRPSHMHKTSRSKTGVNACENTV